MSIDQKNEKRILLSRLLTHSGDQAWDFAVPLALVGLFPSSISVVALYYLCVRFIHILLVTRVCGAMDRWSRIKAVRYGIGLQSIGVVAGGFSIYLLGTSEALRTLSSTVSILCFIGTITAGVMASLGSVMTQVAISQDWIPTIVSPDRLGSVNSRLRQIDLLSELGAPVLTGVIIGLSPGSNPLFGFYAIAAWNLISFLPELLLLTAVYSSKGELSQKTLTLVPQQTSSVFSNLKNGWREFKAQPAAMSMASYALLWFTVLSPHGVLLTAWLKSDWGVPETQIGIFRGLGAVFGLLATLLYPRLLNRMGLLATTRVFILFESVCLIFVGIGFLAGRDHALLFFAAILFSRIGMYGFSLGEVEIRQKTISPDMRGKVNGFASGLTSLATLLVYGAGSLLSDPSQFGFLVLSSIVAVCLAALVFLLWSRSDKTKSLV